MSTATLERPAARLPRLDWPFLFAAVLGAAVLVALVVLDGQPASAALITSSAVMFAPSVIVGVAVTSTV